MREPEIKSINPPTHEPILKVGLILEEDIRTSVSCTANGGSWRIEGIGAAKELADSSTIKVALKNGLLRIENLAEESSRITLHQSKPSKPQPSCGLTITPIRAGRGFHWGTDITATFAGKIEILPSKKGVIVVNHIGLEDYLASVISSEMSAACPEEFAKAQAVAARSWALVFLGNKHQNLPYTICNDDCCQRYQGTTHMTLNSLKAVNECRGVTLVSQSGVVCPAYYSKSCGGKTDTVKEIFNLSGGELTSVFDGPSPDSSDLRNEAQFEHFLDSPPLCYCSEKVVDRSALPKYLGKVDVDEAYFRWQSSISTTLLIEKAKAVLNRDDIVAFKSFTPKSRGKSGRILTADIEFELSGGSSYVHALADQYEIRKILHPSFLFSSAFVLKQNNSQLLEIHGAGWGHGVGLCQIGALGMALRGENYNSILSHYYPQYQLVQAY